MKHVLTTTTHQTISAQGKRKRMEDDFYPHKNQEHNNLFMVCDGMGGHGDGDLAAAFVQMQLPLELFGLSQVSASNMKAAILQTDAKLKFYAQQIGNPKMGSTVAAIQILENEALVGWVGDSRVYHIRNGEILFRTTDHTLMELMLENGEISEDEVIDFPLKHVIYQAIGPVETRVNPSVEKIKNVLPGDVFFLATDGVFEAWNDDELAQLFVHKNCAFAVEINEKCKTISNDNFTFTILSVA